MMRLISCEPCHNKAYPRAYLNYACPDWAGGVGRGEYAIRSVACVDVTLLTY